MKRNSIEVSTRYAAQDTGITVCLQGLSRAGDGPSTDRERPLTGALNSDTFLPRVPYIVGYSPQGASSDEILCPSPKK